MQNFANREPRFQVADGEAIGLTIRLPSTDGGQEGLAARLVDISSRGAKIRSAAKIEDGAEVTMTLESDELPGPLTVSATIRWSRLATGAEWWLGCEFEPAIPAKVLSDFAKTGVLNRRDSNREASSLAAQLYIETCVEPYASRIVNISAGGLCVLGPAIPELGSRVLIRPEDENNDATVTAKVIWHMDTDEGQLIGCAYVDAITAVALRKAARELSSSESVPRRNWSRLLNVFR